MMNIIIYSKVYNNMEVQKAKHQAWAFTWKYLGSQTRRYDVPIMQMAKFGFVKKVVSELDSKGKEHIHGIVMLPRSFHRKRLMCRGFHCCLKEIFNEDQWIKYCDKDIPSFTPYLFDPIYDINT